MGYINQSPDIFELFKELTDRLDRLETTQRFTLPNVAADPANPRKGDAWLNTTSNLAKIVDKNGVVKTVTWS